MNPDNDREITEKKFRRKLLSPIHDKENNLYCKKENLKNITKRSQKRLRILSEYKDNADIENEIISKNSQKRFHILSDDKDSSESENKINSKISQEKLCTLSEYKDNSDSDNEILSKISQRRPLSLSDNKDKSGSENQSISKRSQRKPVIISEYKDNSDIDNEILSEISRRRPRILSEYKDNSDSDNEILSEISRRRPRILSEYKDNFDSDNEILSEISRRRPRILSEYKDYSDSDNEILSDISQKRPLILSDDKHKSGSEIENTSKRSQRRPRILSDGKDKSGSENESISERSQRRRGILSEYKDNSDNDNEILSEISRRRPRILSEYKDNSDSNNEILSEISRRRPRILSKYKDNYDSDNEILSEISRRRSLVLSNDKDKSGSANESISERSQRRRRILSEYKDNSDSDNEVLSEISRRRNLILSDDKDKSGSENESICKRSQRRPRILSDGNYKSDSEYKIISKRSKKRCFRNLSDDKDKSDSGSKVIFKRSKWRRICILSDDTDKSDTENEIISESSQRRPRINKNISKRSHRRQQILSSDEENRYPKEDCSVKKIEEENPTTCMTSPLCEIYNPAQNPVEENENEELISQEDYTSDVEELNAAVTDKEYSEDESTVTNNNIDLPEHYLDRIEWLTPEMKHIFDYVLKLVTDKHFRNNNPTAVFIDGFVGTGKSELLKLLCDYVHNKLGQHVIFIATSGVAALTYHNGRTAHNMFGLPIDIEDDESFWDINDDNENEVSGASLIVLDEVNMLNKLHLNMLNRSLQRLMMSNKIFGGKVIVFSGDFRQLHPVIDGACFRDRAEINDACPKSSHLWKELRIFKLTTALRTKNDAVYSEFLLDLGSDCLQTRNIDAEIEGVQLKNIDYTFDAKEIIDFVYPEDILNNPDLCVYRSILSLIYCNKINEYILGRLRGPSTRFEAEDFVNDNINVDEYIKIQHTLHEDKSFPDRVLELKVGCLCMIIGSLNRPIPFLNGTKVIVENITETTISVRKPGEIEVYKIRKKTFSTFWRYTQINRTQFPLKVCYATAIPKSQGQTLDKVGLDLSTPFLQHGLLYLALGRVRSPKDIKILVTKEQVIDNEVYAANIVYFELLE